MSHIPFEVWECILERVSLESLELCCQGLNKAFNEFLLEWRVRALCWVLAEKGVDEVAMRLKRHHPSGISTDLGRLDQVRRFVERHRDAEVDSVWGWMQLASQEPDAGWLCKGVSIAMLERAGKCVMRQISGKPQAFGMLLDTIKGHSSEVNCVAWNHDGSLLASGSWDGAVRLWTLDGQEKGTLTGHSGSVWSVAFSPDSKTLASASGDETVKLWDLSGDAPVEKGTLTGHSNWVRCVAWNHDGSLLASASDDQTVKLWDPTTMEEKGTLTGHTDSVTRVAWSHDGSLLASGSWDGTVRLWTPDGQEKGTLTGHSDYVFCVAWNHDGSLLASGSRDGSVRLWTPDGQEKGTLRGHTGTPESSLQALAAIHTHFNIDVAEAYKDWDRDEDGVVSLEDLEKALGELNAGLSGEQIRELHEHLEHGGTCDGGGVTKDAWVEAVSAAASSEVVYDPTDSRLKCTLTGHSDYVRYVAFSPDGSLLASASEDGTVKLWDPTAMEEKDTLTGHSGEVNCVAFSPDGSLLASASNNRKVKLWDPTTVEEKGTLTGHSSAVVSVAFSPDSKTFATASHDKTVKLWDFSSGMLTEKGTLKGHSKWVTCVALNHDGSLLASASWDNTVKLWDPTTVEEKGTLTGHSGCVYSIAFSPDSKTLASASGDKTVKLWDLSGDTPVERGTLTGHTDSVTRVAWSHDGSLLASGSWDGTVRLWTPDGLEKSTLKGHVASWQGLDPKTKHLAAKVKSVRSAESSMTGQYIVTANGDMVYSYRTDSDGEKQGKPIACFRSPASDLALTCKGTSVIVGCGDGQVCTMLVVKTFVWPHPTMPLHHICLEGTSAPA